ncbi:MAG: hypothetical protein N3D11_00065 [Candidatus Sumerlaeia bacterium]|nr:hypothetical protein [Candidatus Sumerlaeia bacterium]
MPAVRNTHELESEETDLSILDDLDALQRDPATAELIRSGRTMGCFYIESPSMRGLFQRMRCECYEDVVAASSIIRPGVAESGMMKLYVERFRAARRKPFGDGVSQSKIPNRPVSNPQSVHPHSALRIPQVETLLADTHGVMVYQEDVLKVVHELGGLTLGEADILRRAMCGKGGGRAAFEQLANRFFAGCSARGLREEAVAELWRQIESFAAYSFCKGHSAAFAVLSYQVAYLKAHHPAEFMAAVLSNGGGFYGAAAYIQECRRLGLRVLPPDVNESEVEYSGKTEKGIWDFGFSSLDGEKRTTDPHPPSKIQNRKSKIGYVRVGFSAIKNFPLSLARQIVRARRERLFDGLEDFLRRTRAGPEATESLIRVGAFDRFGIPREQLSLTMDLYFRRRERENDLGDLGFSILNCEKRTTDKDRFTPMKISENLCSSGVPIRSAPSPPSKIQNPKSKIAERVADEIELLGYGVSAHPLDLLPAQVWRGTVAACDMHRHVGRRVTMIGWPIASKLVRTRGQEGRPSRFMKFLSLEDLTDTFEVTLFPQAYRRFAPLTVHVGPFRVRGKIEDEQGALSLVADWLELLAV